MSRKHDFSNRGRADLQAMKAQLSHVLQESWPQYWKVFSDYVQAKISKKEFDSFTRRNLSDQAIQLHNRFVLAILRNAHFAPPPKDFSKSMTGKKRKPLESIKESRKSMNYFEDEYSKSDFTHITFITGRRTDFQTGSAVSVLKRINNLTGFVRIQHTSGDGDYSSFEEPKLSPRSLQLVAYPDLLALRQRMVTAANETGISEVSNDSVSFMMSALEVSFILQMNYKDQIC